MEGLLTLIPILGTAVLALGVSIQGFHILRLANVRPKLIRGLMAGGLMEMLGLFTLIGGADHSHMPFYVVGGFAGGAALAFLWTMTIRTDEPQP